MTEPAFTPGPWEACDPGDYGDFDGDSRVVLGNDMRIAVVHWHDGDYRAENDANAHLIAAAPTMHDALKPFAAWGELCFSGHYGTLADDEVMYASIVTEDGSKVRITAGDLRRVVAALKTAAGEPA